MFPNKDILGNLLRNDILILRNTIFKTLKSEKELARLEKKLGVERLELDQLKQRFEILDEISVKLSKEWVTKPLVQAAIQPQGRFLWPSAQCLITS